MSIRVEVVPFLVVSLVAGAVVALAVRLAGAGWAPTLWSGGCVAGVLGAYMLYFFRDPARIPPADADAIVAGADGTVAAITTLNAEQFRQAAKFCGLDSAGTDAFLKPDVLRVSIFLSLFDVHVNRAPIRGTARFLGYFPGRHLFTFTDKSSDVNQHNAVLLENSRTRCLLTQIVGPVARRVVYWPDHNSAVKIAAGDKIGMMKFGSRMDLYFPSGDVTLAVALGERVRAGETVIAKLRQEVRP